MNHSNNGFKVGLGVVAVCLRLQGDGALLPGDIVYADSGNAVEGGFIVKVDGASGMQSVLSSGGSLTEPFDVAIKGDGRIIVSDSGRLIEIDPETGGQTVLTTQTGMPLGSAYGIDLEVTGDVVAANALNVVRVNVASGAIGLVASGRNLACPLGVAVAAENQLVVADAARPARVVRVHAKNGTQKVVSTGGYLKNPQSIAVRGKDIYVTEAATSDGHQPGVGRVVHVDAGTGRQTVIAEGGYLVTPVGIALDDDGSLIVGDPDTLNPNHHNEHHGAIIRIAPASGRQTLVARGEGGRVNPRGVAIAPATAPSHPGHQHR